MSVDISITTKFWLANAVVLVKYDQDSQWKSIQTIIYKWNKCFFPLLNRFISVISTASVASLSSQTFFQFVMDKKW